MTLPDGSVNNTQISMGQMRTEFRNDSNPILMGQLYRGGGLVPSTQSGTSTTTVGASIANLTGSTVFNSGGQFGSFQQAARFTSNMTCGNNGNVTANGNIVFVASGSGAGNSGQNITMSGGVRVVSINATTNAAGTVTSGTTYANFNGVASVSTYSGTVTTTISSGTSLGIPNGTTSFKMLTYVSVAKNEDNQGESSASASLANPSSGAFTSTNTSSTTTNINGTVPTGAVNDTEFQFSDMYGTFDV